jgi:hypothetical protein
MATNPVKPTETEVGQPTVEQLGEEAKALFDKLDSVYGVGRFEFIRCSVMAMIANLKRK